MKTIWSGPTIIRNIMDLDDRKSFSKIQTELFIRYCAKEEIQRALGNKKSFGDLIFIKILRNNIKDTVSSWKRRAAIIRQKLLKKEK